MDILTLPIAPISPHKYWNLVILNSILPGMGTPMISNMAGGTEKFYFYMSIPEAGLLLTHLLDLWAIMKMCIALSKCFQAKLQKVILSP